MNKPLELPRTSSETTPELLEDIKLRFTLSAVEMYATLELKDKLWSLTEQREFIKTEVVKLFKIAQELYPEGNYVPPADSVKSELDFSYGT